MSTPISRILSICILAVSFSLGLNAAEIVLQRVSPVAVQQVSGDHNSAMALLAQDPALGYALASGSKTVVITLSKIENVDTISFLNNGTKGDITIAVSNAKLPANSPQWEVVAHQELSANATKAKVGPTEAKYLRLTFNVTEGGRLADLGVYSAPSLSFGQVDSKDAKDAKDFSKEVPEPAEGPPIPLQPPPPFPNIPEIVPTSP
jgi:hypothetical protein